MNSAGYRASGAFTRSPTNGSLRTVGFGWPGEASERTRTGANKTRRCHPLPQDSGRRQGFGRNDPRTLPRTSDRRLHCKRKCQICSGFNGRYWARTSVPQLVELVLTGRFAAVFSAVGKYLGKSHTGEGGFGRLSADAGRYSREPCSMNNSSCTPSCESAFLNSLKRQRASANVFRFAEASR